MSETSTSFYIIAALGFSRGVRRNSNHNRFGQPFISLTATINGNEQPKDKDKQVDIGQIH